MTKIQYITPDGTIYPSEFIVDRCKLICIDKSGNEFYECYKKGKRCVLTVKRHEVSTYTLDLPYGYSDDAELKEHSI